MTGEFIYLLYLTCYVARSGNGMKNQVVWKDLPNDIKDTWNSLAKIIEHAFSVITKD